MMREEEELESSDPDNSDLLIVLLNENVNINQEDIQFVL
jgi:hypothetical protein